MSSYFPKDARRPEHLLVHYLLWCINELPEAEAQKLRECTAKLQSDEKKDGDWQGLVRAALGLPNDLPDRIRELWRRNSEAARSCGLTLTPKQFAQNVVERNFKDLAQKFAEPDR